MPIFAITGLKTGSMYDLAKLALLFLQLEGGEELEQVPQEYGDPQEWETKELLCFVKKAREELRRRDLPPTGSVRITRQKRIFLGGREIKARPMAKCVLLLFLRHPEGIVLKDIYNYREELYGYYRHVSKSSDPEAISRSVQRLLDICNNELNINISRVNSAINAILDSTEADAYRIRGRAGQRKSIPLPEESVIWE